MSSFIITRKEVLLEFSKRIGKFDEMWQLTEATMRGEIPFRTSFLYALLRECIEVVKQGEHSPEIERSFQQLARANKCPVIWGCT